MADQESPAFFQISRHNHSPWVAVISISFIVYSILAVAAKIISRLHLSSLKSYDWLIITSTTLAFGQTICVVGACKNGLGQHEAALSSRSLSIYAKYTYTASMLFIAANAFAKASVVFFIMKITPQREIWLACYTLLAIVIAWGLAGVLALAFQCHRPTPWSLNQATCINQWALYLALGILNIITDLALVVIPVAMMWWVQARAAKRWTVIALFTSRLLVPAFTIPQLVTLNNHLAADDSTWTQVGAAIWSQVVMNTSILTACIPSMKGVIDMFISGTSLFTVPEQYKSTLSSGSYGLRLRVKSALGLTSGSNKSSNHAAATSSSRNEWPPRHPNMPTGQHSAQVSGALGKRQVGLGNLAERSESQKSLTEDAILRTVDYEVEFEEANGYNKHSQSSVDGEERSVHGTRR